MLRLAVLIAVLPTAMTLCAACDKPAAADGEHASVTNDARKHYHKHNGHGGEGDGGGKKGHGGGGGAKGEFKVGRLDRKQIPESSGIIDSRKYPGVFWTFNDSGNGPTIFAVRRDGTLLNRFT